MTESSERRGPLQSSPNLSDGCEVREIDDILVTRLRGYYTLEVAREVQVRTNALGSRHGYRLLMFDVRQLKDVPPDTRRFLVEDQQRERKETSLAIVGASFAMRTMAMMMIRAVSILTKIPLGLKFFETEEQARTWLEHERNRLRTLIASRKVP